MAIALGLDAVLMRGTAGSKGTTEVRNVKVLTLNLESNEADVTTRATQGWRTSAATLKEASLEFSILYNTEDTDYNAFADAHFNNTPLSLFVSDGTIKRVRALCGVDLANIISIEPGKAPDVGLLDRLATDPVLLVDVLYAVCKPEADAQNVSNEDFGRAMAGDAIAHAAAALLDEVIYFFPEAKRKVFRKIIGASCRFEAQSKEALTAFLDDPAFDAGIDQAFERLTVSSAAVPELPE